MSMLYDPQAQVRIHDLYGFQGTAEDSIPQPTVFLFGRSQRDLLSIFAQINFRDLPPYLTYVCRLMYKKNIGGRRFWGFPSSVACQFILGSVA